MKKLYSILLLSSASLTSYSQQDLRDPRYIYSLDDKNYRGQSIAYNMNWPDRVSFLYNGRLYKNVDYTSFIYDSALIYHEIRPCYSRKEARKLTGERGIKRLFVVGEFSSTRKLFTETPEYRKYLRPR